MSEKQYIVALDQGTTSSRAVILDHNADIVGVSQREFRQIYPKAGWVEHDPLEIWASQSSTLTEVLNKSNVKPEQVAAIGITNQRETTLVWNKETGKPIYNAIVWQCRRTADMCEKYKEQGLEGYLFEDHVFEDHVFKDHAFENYVKENTGLLLDPYFSASKIKWILDNVEGARELASQDKLLFGTVDTWLLWKMTQGQVHVTDYTNASRTMLFNIDALEWDDHLLKAFDIPKSMMPSVQPSSHIYGYTNISGTQIPIAGIAGDQQAALFGQMCVDAGQAKNTYGTGCFLLMNTGKEKVTSKHGLLTTLACNAQGKPAYALEGAVFMAGASIQWLRDELKLLTDAKDSERMATQVDSSNGVYVVPAFCRAWSAVLGCLRPWNDCWAESRLKQQPHCSSYP